MGTSTHSYLWRNNVACKAFLSGKMLEESVGKALVTDDECTDTVSPNTLSMPNTSRRPTQLVFPLLNAVLSQVGLLLSAPLAKQLAYRIGVQIGQDVAPRAIQPRTRKPPLGTFIRSCLAHVFPGAERAFAVRSVGEDAATVTIRTCPYGTDCFSQPTLPCWLEAGLFAGIAEANGRQVVLSIQREQTPSMGNCVLTMTPTRSVNPQSEHRIHFAGEPDSQDDRLPGEGNGRISTLTVREREILHLIGEGLSSPQIAARLTLSVRTVENHGAHIRDKLQLRSRAALIRFACELLLEPK